LWFPITLAPTCGRLLLKGFKAAFPNICASIRHLFELYKSHLFNIQRIANMFACNFSVYDYCDSVHRRFTYTHLAQLKYIMSEAIVINKILLHVANQQAT
jgi:chromatin licensing and DNA replication factor 1